MYWIGLRPGDVHLNVSSPGWAKHAWSNFFAPWNAGAEILIVNQPRFAARPLLDAMARLGVTSFCAPPTVWRMLVLEDLTQWKIPLRELVGAGEPLNPEIIERVRDAWGVVLRDGFGQTETTAQVGNPPGIEVHPGSMGLPLPGYEIALVDPVTGAVVTEPGAEGEICLPLASEPLGLMTGYQDDPERQAAATAGGFYHTGDVAFREADGYVTYVGRTDDVFKSSDYRISPFELESVLLEHPAVAEAAVVPSPDTQGVPGDGSRVRAGRGDRTLGPGVRQGPAGPLQAGPAGGVRRAAEDGLRQDQEDRTARARGRSPRRSRGPGARFRPRQHRVLGGGFPPGTALTSTPLC
jgi:acetyl-CoA synthetase